MAMYSIGPTELIEELAKELQKVESIKPPLWASFVKTGNNKERPPAREDWWYVRAASVLRKVRIKGPIGVSKLRIFYGGKKHRGYAPERFRKGSGNILRKILQQLEKAELIKKVEKDIRKGRLITPKGIKLLDNVANKLARSRSIEKKVEEKKEDIKEKREELAKKTKELAQGKIQTAEKSVGDEKKAPKAAESAEKKAAENKNG